MRLPGARIIVILGMMTRMPVAGVIWQYVHYLIGLKRLGYDVYYVESHCATPTGLMESKQDDPFAKAAAFIDRVLKQYDLGDRWAYHAVADQGQCYGMTLLQLRELYRNADLIINLHGGTIPLPEHYETGRLVYLETDPVQLQIELDQNLAETIAFVEPHMAFFTFADNYGREDCQLPVHPRFQFKPTRQPVLMDLWKSDAAPSSSAFTTIGNWQQRWREVKFNGQTYHWSKHYEFLKFIDLPQQTDQRFELALSQCPASEKEMLNSKGWHTRDALALSREAEPYQRYIMDSRGEFTVAKDQNVRLRTGWFSDRSATYLAAGRPVITQETGFSNVLPTGAGLFGFSTLEDVLSAIDYINSDYPHHCDAATELAQEYFSHDSVLPRMLAEVGL